MGVGKEKRNRGGGEKKKSVVVLVVHIWRKERYEKYMRGGEREREKEREGVLTTHGRGGARHTHSGARGGEEREVDTD